MFASRSSLCFVDLRLEQRVDEAKKRSGNGTCDLQTINAPNTAAKTIPRGSPAVSWST